jgi:hypothetical protein
MQGCSECPSLAPSAILALLRMRALISHSLAPPQAGPSFRARRAIAIALHRDILRHQPGGLTRYDRAPGSVAPFGAPSLTLAPLRESGAIFFGPGRRAITIAVDS